jgi:hypothetical protein
VAVDPPTGSRLRLRGVVVTGERVAAWTDGRSTSGYSRTTTLAAVADYSRRSKPPELVDLFEPFDGRVVYDEPKTILELTVP